MERTLEPMMEEQMSATVKTAMSGHTGATAETARGKSCFSKSPIPIGATTTCSVELTMAAVSTRTSEPASMDVSAGVASVARKVEHVVSTTDNATSALPMYVTRLEAVPPGEQATRRTPTASEGSRPANRATAIPSKGMTEYCSAKPEKTALGDAVRRLSKSSVSPILNIMKANPVENHSGRSHANALGWLRARTAPATINMGYEELTTSHTRTSSEGGP
mmetsp:Transcript_11733/g.38601  ORF Transcript_11733/g.38601 Transcript_11733/m.38601 type:complete len:220 (+) Transcript_11733:335-994(+)